MLFSDARAQALKKLRFKSCAFYALPFCLATLRGSGAGFEEPLAENLPR